MNADTPGISFISCRTTRFMFTRSTLAAAACLTALFGGCASSPTMASLDIPAPTVLNDVHVEVDGLLRRRGARGIYGLRGVATNQTEEEMKFCTVTFEILDTTGAKIGSAVASTTHLAPGRTWRFDAHNLGTIPAGIGKIRLADVTTDLSIVSGAGVAAVETGGLDPVGLAALAPGETTLGDAVELLGADPMSKNHQPDGSTLATWSHTRIQGARVAVRTAAILFDAEGAMVRIMNKTSTGQW